MDLFVFLAILAGLVGLRVLDARVVRVNPLAWVTAWWVAVYLFLNYGVVPPLPSSLVGMFMGIVTISLLLYLTAYTERMEAARRVIVRFMVEDRFRIPLVLVIALIPALVAWQVYLDATAEPQPPLTSRTIHPPPPTQITFEGETMNLVSATNPYREFEESEPDSFARHVANGRRVYFENCVYCHGDDMRGEGEFAHALDPLPANFQDAGTIAQLQESYLFWRIAKGAPGLPAEATPWKSAMPAWEGILSEREIWDVILFLYEYTGHEPRAEGEPSQTESE